MLRRKSFRVFSTYVTQSTLNEVVGFKIADGWYEFLPNNLGCIEWIQNLNREESSMHRYKKKLLSSYMENVMLTRKEQIRKIIPIRNNQFEQSLF
jgi:radical SAM superfamily enzyme with C-terminal helix-hairpin-helix motif